MFLICGLGNPGVNYKNTRHNVGFHLADNIISHFNLDKIKEDRKKELYSGVINNQKIFVLKPLTFMNLSGECASALKSFYKLSNNDIHVIYDDIDLPLGELRYRESGGPGTHNGMKSLIQHIGNDFPRLRFGIENRPEELKKKINLSDYVLGKFRKEEESTVQKTIEEGVSTLSEKM